MFCVMTAVSLLSGGLAEPTEYIVGEKIVPTLPLPPLEEGKIVDLPVEKDPKIGPHEECFIFEGDDTKAPTGYADPSITVNIGRGRAEYTFESGGKQRTDTANYIYAKVKIAHPSQIRTAMAGTLRTDNTSLGSSLAQREKAVVAINADYGGSKTFKGSVYRQGKELRLNSKGNVDVLVIDKNGDLVILPKATNEDVQRAAAEGAVNIFTFGPALVLDGQPQYGYTERSMDTEGRAQRMAIAQLGPLHHGGEQFGLVVDIGRIVGAEAGMGETCGGLMQRSSHAASPEAHLRGVVLAGNDLTGKPAQQRGGGAHQPVKGQGPGAGQVKDQAAHRKPGNGRRGEEGHHAQGLGEAELNHHAGRAGE